LVVGKQEDDKWIRIHFPSYVELSKMLSMVTFDIHLTEKEIETYSSFLLEIKAISESVFENGHWSTLEEIEHMIVQLEIIHMPRLAEYQGNNLNPKHKDLFVEEESFN
jgi:hypothetical protein